MSSSPHDVSQLLAEHGRQLHAMLFRLTLRADVAEDLLQDLFCKLAQSDSFRRADRPAAFAFRTAMNLAFDWQRSQKRMLMSDADIAAQPSLAASAISDLVCREELEQTLTGIGELPTMNRDILVLRYLQQKVRWFSTQPSNNVAFAQVQEQVAKTKSVHFNQTTKTIANDEVSYEDSGRTMILGTSQSREECRVIKQPKVEEPLRKKRFIHITNSKTKTSLYLYPEEKEYFLVTSSNMLPGLDLYRMFHDVPADRTKKLPEKLLNGKQVVGFVLVSSIDHPNDKTQWAETTTYWVDVKAKLPVRIEYTGRNKNSDAHESCETTRSDFIFDAPLDESLFSTDPPKGWKDVSERFVVPIK